MDKTLDGALDVRLLRVLLMLLTEKSVSRTAELLGQPQPTISLSLRRLRNILGDPLLIRQGNRLVPTDRGLELQVSVAQILQDIERQVLKAPQFQPDTSSLHFRVVVSSYLDTTLVPRLIKVIRDTAPEVTVDFAPMPRWKNFSRLFMGGDFPDLVIGNWPHPPEELRIAPLITADVVCLVNSAHPLARRGRVSLEDYLAASHLSLSPAEHAGMSPIDSRLSELGLHRRVAISAPEYVGVPYILAETDLLFTTGRHFAELLAQVMPLSILETPAEFGSMTFYMLWHESKHRTPAHKWLRGLVKQVAGSFDGHAAHQQGTRDAGKTGARPSVDLAAR